MKNPRGWLTPITVALSLAAICFLGVVGVYIAHFGTRPSLDHELWGEFGEYFGGLLGPVFSFGAFIGVLWTIQLQMRALEDSRRQQVENSMFQLLRRLARIRASPTYYTEGPPHGPEAVSFDELTRGAWKEWITLVRGRNAETTEQGARAHLSEVGSRLIASKYNNITVVTDELMRLYGYVYRARIPETTKALYVQLINGEVSTLERMLLLVTLFTQPAGGAAFAVVNSLGVFYNLDLASNIKMPDVYRRVLSQTYPHVAREGERPLSAL